MSTDLYSAELREVEHATGTLTLEIRVIYYDGSRFPQQLPTDASFFLRLLHRAVPRGPLAEAIRPGEITDEGWVNLNTHRFIRSVTRLSSQNDVVEGHRRCFELLEREEDIPEDVIVKGEYRVTLIDPHHTRSLSAGQVWWTTAYETESMLLEVDTRHGGLPRPDAIPLRVPHDGVKLSELISTPDGRWLLLSIFISDVLCIDPKHWTLEDRGKDLPRYRHILADLDIPPLEDTLVYADEEDDDEAQEETPGPRFHDKYDITLCWASPKRRYLLAFLWDKDAIEVFRADGSFLWRSPVGETMDDSFYSATFSADDATVAFVPGGGEPCYVHTLETGELRATLDFDDDIISNIALSPSGDRVALCGDEVWIFDVESGQRILRYRPEDADHCTTSCCAWAPDGTYIVIGRSRTNHSYDYVSGDLAIFQLQPEG